MRGNASCFLSWGAGGGGVDSALTCSLHNYQQFSFPCLNKLASYHTDTGRSGTVRASPSEIRCLWRGGVDRQRGVPSSGNAGVYLNGTSKDCKIGEPESTISRHRCADKEIKELNCNKEAFLLQCCVVYYVCENSLQFIHVPANHPCLPPP